MKLAEIINIKLDLCQACRWHSKVSAHVVDVVVPAEKVSGIGKQFSLSTNKSKNRKMGKTK